MTHYLFTTLPTNDLGLVTRALPIARELADRGHRVTFSSPARAPRLLISAAGFENRTPPQPLFELMEVGGLGDLLRSVAARAGRPGRSGLLGFLRSVVPAFPIRYAPATSAVWDTDHAGALMGMLNEGFVRASVEALRALITDTRADVLVDFWNPLAVLAARTLGVPVITVIQADAHPASRGFIWWQKRPTGVPTPVPVVNQVLDSYGLMPVRALADLCVGDLTLVVGMPEMDPLPAGADVTYVGALLWQDARSPLPTWMRKRSTARPLIWVYSGNPRYTRGRGSLDSIAIVHACVEALAGEDVTVVLTTGHHALPPELRPLPSNFHHEAYVPGLATAQASDLLIHHGGYGSCQAGLLAGTPAVIMPTFSERESNARRIAAAGAGLIVPVEGAGRSKWVSPDALRAAVRRVLADPRFRKRARSIGERLKSYGGAPRAAALISSVRTPDDGGTRA
jgi:UDP:flavonoid glycosyltransferase YjiC (YdhE family)